MSETTRFAPSPTGLLHVGHALAAITAKEMSCGGRFLLRIEDLDRARSREEYVAAIFEDLAWLGLDWETPVLRQSARTEAYQAALELLQRRNLVYPCFCTRRDIADEMERAGGAPHATGSHPAVYPGTCRRLSDAQRERRIGSGERFALRLDAQRAAEMCGALTFQDLTEGTAKVSPRLFGDVVLARKDLPAAYHLAVVVDDAFQGVTLVTRGNDLLPATHVQRVLQSVLGLPTPRYAHHPLILDSSGKKFSKRDHSVTLQSLRNAGVSAAEVRARAAVHL